MPFKTYLSLRITGYAIQGIPHPEERLLRPRLEGRTIDGPALIRSPNGTQILGSYITLVSGLANRSHSPPVLVGAMLGKLFKILNRPFSACARFMSM